LKAGNLYYDLFDQVFKQFIEPAHPKSKIRILIFHDDLEVPINLAFMDNQDLTVQLVFDTVDKTVQSKKKDPYFTIQSYKKMTISLIITENPEGSGRAFNYNKPRSKSKTIVKSDILNFQEYVKSLKSVHFMSA